MRLRLAHAMAAMHAPAVASKTSKATAVLIRGSCQTVKANYPNDHDQSTGEHDHTTAPPHVWIVATDLSVKPRLATKVRRRPI